MKSTLEREMPGQKIARLTIAHRDAEAVAEVILGVPRHVDAMTTPVVRLPVRRKDLLFLGCFAHGPRRCALVARGAKFQSARAVGQRQLLPSLSVVENAGECAPRLGTRDALTRGFDARRGKSFHRAEFSISRTKARCVNGPVQDDVRERQIHLIVLALGEARAEGRHEVSAQNERERAKASAFFLRHA